MTTSPYDLVVLAGGAGLRLGGADKAEVVVAGQRLLDRVLAAAPGAGRRVVVGPVRPSVEQVTWCREHPPGGGPRAALAAALPLVDAPYAVVLAVDLALVDAAVVTALLTAAADRDGAIGIDPAGRDQPLLAAYDVAALRTALTALGPAAGAPMRAVVARLDLARVEVAEAALDCDTWADVAHAEALVLRARTSGTGSPRANRSSTG